MTLVNKHAAKSRNKVIIDSEGLSRVKSEKEAKELFLIAFQTAEVWQVRFSTYEVAKAIYRRKQVRAYG